jgi:hypothetical protein
MPAVHPRPHRRPDTAPATTAAAEPIACSQHRHRPRPSCPSGPGQPRCARYAPRQDHFEHVSAGQGHTQQPSPEPCAQVRILLGALLGGINSNTLTILVRSGPEPVTCGNAEAFRILPPGRPRQRAAQRQTRCSAAFRDNGRKAVAVAKDRCSSSSIRSYAGQIVARRHPRGRPSSTSARAAAVQRRAPSVGLSRMPHLRRWAISTAKYGMSLHNRRRRAPTSPILGGQNRLRAP